MDWGSRAKKHMRTIYCDPEQVRVVLPTNPLPCQGYFPGSGHFMVITSQYRKPLKALRYQDVAGFLRLLSLFPGKSLLTQRFLKGKSEPPRGFHMSHCQKFRSPVLWPFFKGKNSRFCLIHRGSTQANMTKTLTEELALRFPKPKQFPTSS